MLEMVICGRGGQGVVFLTRQIGQIISDKGLNVISSETHGMAVRGGSINSHLRIGDFQSPLIRPYHADFILSLDESETSNNIHFLKTGGIVVENSNKQSNSDARRINATEIARNEGRAQLENIVLLGYAATMDGFPITTDEIQRQIAKDKRDSIRDANIKAFNLGVAYGAGATSVT